MLLSTNNVNSSFHIDSIAFCSFSASFHWLWHQAVTLYAGVIFSVHRTSKSFFPLLLKSHSEFKLTHLILDIAEKCSGRQDRQQQSSFCSCEVAVAVFECWTVSRKYPGSCKELWNRANPWQGQKPFYLSHCLVLVLLRMHRSAREEVPKFLL